MSTPPITNVGSDLVLTHKVFTRALNVMMRQGQAAGSDPDLRGGFRFYILAFHNALEAHHLGEDEIAFPFWQTKYPSGPYYRLLSHHQRILLFLEKIQFWLDCGSEAWESQTLAQLNSTLAALNGLWHSHIPLEEETIGPRNASQYLTTDDNVLLATQLATFYQQHALPHELTVPFMLYNLPVEERPALARIFPDVMVQYLAPITWKTSWAPMQPFLLE